MSQTNIHSLADLLNSGGVILKPTDTILGLGANALLPEAFNRIAEIKNRPISKGFVILVDMPARLERHVDVHPMAWEMMDMSEKPITFVYENPRELPPHLLGEDGSVAIRLTDNLLCKKIIQRINAPLISTSANLSGEPAPRLLHEVNPKIKQAVDLVLPECADFEPQHTASSVIKLSADGRVTVFRE